MTPAHDPLHEPLRLLREARLPAGFEERLAERLAAIQPRSNLVRLPGRKRILLLVAAIALPALAAAAGAYYVQRRSSAALPVTSAEKAPTQVEVKQVDHPLPKAGLTATVPPAEPTASDEEKRSAPRSQKSSRPSNVAPKTESLQPNQPKTEQATLPPPANAAPRIEALDPFASQSITSKQPAAKPRGAEVSEHLRKAAEQGAARTREDSTRGSRRDAQVNENRGNDAAQQARERVQARERKGQ
jgi:hypothetical protein